jgi:hypothetical protein
MQLFAKSRSRRTSKKHQQDEAPGEFQCSAGFIASYNARNNFASRRSQLKRRRRVTPEEREAWIGKLVQLLSDVNDHSRIINVDESCWRVYPGALKTWAPIGSQNVHLPVKGNEKDSFTVMAAIIVARRKLPLCMIAARKTALVEHSHFADVAYHHTMHSESGW